MSAACGSALAREKHGLSAHKRFARKRAPTFGLLLAANFAFAQIATPTTPINDPALEARVKALSSELRCLVCQNQTVADSDAPVARDMREQVRAQLVSGKSEDEVKRYMTERFGDFVLYKPPMKASTAVLWIAPFAALLLGVFLLTRRLRRAQTNAPTSVALTDAERARAKALLEDDKNSA
ncbi:MAG: cytochrome c-type biogenesis protein [Casimicrobium sp.]